MDRRCAVVMRVCAWVLGGVCGLTCCARAAGLSTVGEGGGLSVKLAGGPVVSTPHRIEGIDRTDSGSLRLTLSGGVTGADDVFFDIFSLEGSIDLSDWSVTESAVRTNAVGGSVQFLVPSVGHGRYFRTPTNAAPSAFPKPTGRFQVGTVSRLFASEGRTSTDVGPHRQFVASIVYPAAPAEWSPHEIVFEPVFGPDLFTFGFLTTPRPLEVVTNLVSHAASRRPVLAGTNAFPVLVYCHGGTYFRRDNLHKLCELASHGYIVVAADYYHAFYSYWPDGSLVIGPGFLSEGEAASVADTTFLLDRLEQMNRSDPVFAGRFDLSGVGIFGWSVGGAEAGDVARVEPRVKAAVLYDAAFWVAPDLTRDGLTKPFLCINATTELATGWMAPAIDLFNRATRDAIFFAIDNTQHGDFSDLSLIDDPGAAQQARSALIVDYTLAFFNHYLRGMPEPLLAAPPTNGPAIVRWMKK